MRHSTAWLSGQLGAGWWRSLPDRHYRLWLNLLALSVDDPGGGWRVDVPLDDLVALCGASRQTIRAALADLSDAGLCRAALSAGRARMVVVLGTDHTLGTATVPSTGARIIPLFPAKDLDTAPRRPDQDLSGALRDPPDQRSRFAGPQSRNQRERSPDRSRDQDDPNTQCPGSGPQWPEGFRDVDEDRRAARINAAKIPARAWAAADYLRGELVKAEPASAVARETWTAEPVGRRLQWADEFRLIHERDGHPWDEIARTLHWVFNAQGLEYRIEVESPGALRTKWDRIQRARKRQQERTGIQRGADGRPDPMAGRPTKTWTGNE